MTETQKEVDIDLSEDQVEAIDKVREWWQTDRQTFVLAGYAGTGKTTVISKLLKSWDSPVIVGAPTGKAAQRLREKGVRAETIHSLAYRPVGQDEDGDPIFDYIGIRQSKSLVIIDEASMVNGEIYRDLIDGGYRMLFVGDHGQLPPVGNDPGIMRNPNFTLRVIHRQDDEGLLDFAHALRGGAHRPPARGAVSVSWMPPGFRPNDPIHGITQRIAGSDTVICWKNKTRHMLNIALMQARGLLPADQITTGKAVHYLRLLHEAEKAFPVICLRNDHRKGLFNGMSYMLKIEKLLNATLVGELTDDTGKSRAMQIGLNGFLSDRGEQPLPGCGLFDFGSCITAHKSQGSEWPSVAVYDDTFLGMEDRARWAYTAATRAKEFLQWFHS